MSTATLPLNTSTPESLNGSMASPQHEALLDVGEKIRHWQLEQIPRLSDAQILARYLELGSTRSYKRIHTGDGIEGLDVDDWLARYQSVWHKIQTETLIRSTEPVYDDLSPTVAIRAAVSRLMRETGQQRLVVVQGDTGSGKTVGLRAVAAIYGGTAYLIESHEGWGSPAAATRYLAKGLRIDPGEAEAKPQSTGDWIELIIKALNARGRRLILLDECQHWSGETLNILKTLINRTDCVFVVGAMGTLWDKLTSTRSQEAKQLTLNRMLERVILNGPSQDDAVAYLKRRAGLKASKGLITRLLDLARTRGKFAFLRRVVTRLEEPDAEPPMDDDTRLAHAIQSAIVALQGGTEA